MPFLSPFKKYHLADFHNVVVRLADAQGDRRDSPASTLSNKLDVERCGEG